MLSIADEQGRFPPRDDDTREPIHPGDMVIEAVGQSTDESLLGEALTEALEWRRGRLNINEARRTSEPRLWAAGDMVRWPARVSAVADGHRVAENINEYQKNKTPTLLQWRRTSHYPVILAAPLCVKPYSRTLR